MARAWRLLVGRIGRTAGGHQGPAVGPGPQLLGPGLGRARRTREQEDGGALDVVGHLSHHLFAEQSGDPGDANEGGRLQRPHHRPQVGARPQPVGRGQPRRPGHLSAGLVALPDDQPVIAEKGDRSGQCLFDQPLTLEGRTKQAGGSHRGRRGAGHEDSLFGQLRPRGAAGGEDPGQGHCRGSLDVVVEGGELGAVALEHREGNLWREVLPLQQGLGEAQLHRSDELLDHRLVLCSAQAGLPPADVEIVLGQGAIVGPYVQADRQGLGRVDPGRGHVEGELAQRQRHPPGALVPETKDPLVVGGHDEADVLVGRVGEHLGHSSSVLGGDPQAAGAPEDAAVVLAGLPHRRGVHDGQEFLEMVHEHSEEEVLVAVLQRGEPHVAVEGPIPPGHVPVGPPRLLLHRADNVGEEALEAQGPALFRGEGGGAVVHRVREQLRASQPHLHPLPAVGTALETIGFHGQTGQAYYGTRTMGSAAPGGGMPQEDREIVHENRIAVFAGGLRRPW